MNKRLHELDLNEDILSKIAPLLIESSDSESSMSGDSDPLQVDELFDSNTSASSSNDSDSNSYLKKINVLTKDQEIFLELVKHISDPNLQKDYLDKLLKTMDSDKAGTSAEISKDNSDNESNPDDGDEIKVENIESIPNDFLFVLKQITTRKYLIKVTLIFSDDFAMDAIALFDTGADLNCIREEIVPKRFHEKTKERLSAANNSKLNIMPPKKNKGKAVLKDTGSQEPSKEPQSTPSKEKLLSSAMPIKSWIEMVEEHGAQYKSISSDDQVKQWMSSITKSPELMLALKNLSQSQISPQKEIEITKPSSQNVVVSTESSSSQIVLSQPTPSKKTSDWCKFQLLQNLSVVPQFDSVEDADAWYINYSRLVGFSVRKNKLRRSKSGRITIRRWVCNLKGYRAERYLANDNIVREPRPITRTGCKASFRVNYDNSSGKYTVTEFRTEHNHPLTSPNEVHLLRSHWHVSEGDLAQAKALRHISVKTCQVVDYMDADRCAEIGDIDSMATIAYFTAKSDNDPGLYHEYTLDDENRLRNLFWTDYMARYDYECFGDVLAFDATYKTNAYQKPLVTLVGTNHHCRTTVFGFALLGNETVESYTWLLQTFLSTMGNGRPKSVITDGDKAMSKAIKTVFVGATHRISAGEFDQWWFALVDEFKLHEHGWVKKMYAKRHKWAKAFLKGTFFADIKWTVVYNKPTNKIDCSCQMMDSAGISCRHMFHVMKVEQFRNIPDNMILHRWTKKVKDYTSCSLARSQVDSEISNVARFSSLSTATNKMYFYAAKNEHSYKEALAAINQLTSKFQELFGGQRTCPQSSVYNPLTKSMVLDPVVVRTKDLSNRLASFEQESSGTKSANQFDAIWQVGFVPESSGTKPANRLTKIGRSDSFQRVLECNWLTGSSGTKPANRLAKIGRSDSFQRVLERNWLTGWRDLASRIRSRAFTPILYVFAFYVDNMALAWAVCSANVTFA
ncbi:protein FAR1-RELATED SEQUENCE [Citrus sinensis]|nr:protein FAR1-RELATED SEQUENCE [Citrus sinensis]